MSGLILPEYLLSARWREFWFSQRNSGTNNRLLRGLPLSVSHVRSAGPTRPRGRPLFREISPEMPRFVNKVFRPSALKCLSVLSASKLSLMLRVPLLYLIFSWSLRL